MRTTQACVLAFAGILGAGCYQQTYQTTPAPQFQPQPVYVQGPPGGQMDDQVAVTVEGSVGGSIGVGVRGEVGSEGAIDGGPAPSAVPQDPGYVMGSVTDAEIDTTLEGYGAWVEDPEYGRIWRPDATVVGVDFTPYETCGTWMWTDYGWTFSCDWSWGWLPFHYGQWGWFDDYWAWVPDYTWSPAWVEWRHGGGYVGWRPVGPRVRDHRNGTSAGGAVAGGGRGPIVRDHRGRRSGAADWRFVADRDLAAGRRIRPSLIHSNAEGLRATRVVARPPIRAATTANTRVTDVMRDRITSRNSAVAGPRGRGAGVYRPSSPAAGSGSTSSTPGPTVWSPPSRGWQQNPSRTYRPPSGVYTPPSRTYQPSAPPSHGTYQPYTPSTPSRATTQPSRTHEPFTPSEPSRVTPPSRSYEPLAPSGPSRVTPQPSRTYQPVTPSQTTPPSRAYQPVAPSAPSRVYTPASPSRGYTPPSRSYTPASPPSRASSSSSSSSRSYAAPSSSSRSYAAPSSSSRSSGSSSHSGGGRRR